MKYFQIRIAINLIPLFWFLIGIIQGCSDYTARENSRAGPIVTDSRNLSERNSADTTPNPTSPPTPPPTSPPGGTTTPGTFPPGGTTPPTTLPPITITPPPTPPPVTIVEKETVVETVCVFVGKKPAASSSGSSLPSCDKEVIIETPCEWMPQGKSYHYFKHKKGHKPRPTDPTNCENLRTMKDYGVSSN